MEETSRGRPSNEWRALAAFVTAVIAGGTTLAFLGVAWIIATFNCEDGCGVGSRWAPGAWGSNVELWGLAVPATLAVCGLVLAVAAGWRWASLVMWFINLGLLIAWCIFTGASRVPIDFSGTNSHWMWLTGLMVAAVGGLVGVATLFLGGQRRVARRPNFS